MELADEDLSTNYRTHCDPRLNYEQSLGEYAYGSKCLELIQQTLHSYWQIT